jgi:uncharacterized protein
MNPVFADTSYFVAFLNQRDEFHRAAVDWWKKSLNTLVTTTWVLVELGNYLAKSRSRRRYGVFVRDLRAEPRVEVRSADEELFNRGLALYARRPDKAWSMTDCISFIVMERDKLKQALTADHHFEQAGFAILLK